MEISLSVLGLDFNNVSSVLKPLEKELNYVHLDVMDGHFVPNISFGADVIACLRKHYQMIFDTHLMIENVEKYLDDFIKAGSDYITFHLEAVKDPMPLINKIHSAGIKAGLSIKPDTPIEELKPYLPYLDMVLIMSVEPGFGGQSFMHNAIDKVSYLRKLKEQFNYSYLINIDGGIQNETLPLVASYIDLAVSGSYITKSEDPLKNLMILKNI